jgi:hypothetical protein
MMARRLFLFGFVTALLTALGCSSGGDGGTTTTPALLCGDASPAAANAVTLTCGGSADGTIERIDVVVGGPASGTTTVRGFNFDVTYDPSKLEFVSAASDTSDLFPPSALLVASLYNGQPGQVVVSIQQAGSDPDVVVVAGQHVALSLSFRRVAGVTFAPTPLEFENAEATAASPAIGFPGASGLALSYQ